MFQMRSSKFRHVYGCASRKEDCYEGVRVTTNAHDSNFCEVNPKFVAIVIESIGGGVFIVIPVNKTGRVGGTCGKVAGHRGYITDIKWDPFNDNVIASCSDDASIKLWTIPEGGLNETMTTCTIEMRGHMKKVSKIEWHPLAQGVLLSVGYDGKCILWKTDSGQKMISLSLHNDVIFSISWSPDGRYFASTCKDRTIRVIDPRNGVVVVQGEGHSGTKSSKVVFVFDDRLFTTGFSRMSERQFALWDVKDLSKPLKAENVDCSSGILLPYYDTDTRVMFLAGKGDGNIRFYEITSSPPYVHYLQQFQSGYPQRGLGQMPKRGVDVRKCEIVRFYKLHTNKDVCEPISMIVPRKLDIFHEDIFPPTTSSLYPCLSADEWFSGVDRMPKLVSLKFEPTTPPATTSPPLSSPTRSISTIRNRPDTTNTTTNNITTILPPPPPPGSATTKTSTTTTLTINNNIPQQQQPQQSSSSSSTTLGDSLIDGGSVAVVLRRGGGTSAGPTPSPSQITKIPDSLRNIHRLSTCNDFVRDLGGTPNSSLSRLSMDSFKSGFYNVGQTRSPYINGCDDDDHDQRKMELKKTFHEHLDEIRRLRLQLAQKDQCIRQLEDEIRKLKQGGGSGDKMATVIGDDRHNADDDANAYDDVIKGDDDVIVKGVRNW